MPDVGTVAGFVPSLVAPLPGDGLYDLTHARQQAQRLAPELERTIVFIRQQLESRAHPRTHYSLIGARSILAELKGLGIHPLPCLRTIERVLQRYRISVPRVGLARFLCDRAYPDTQPSDSNQLLQVDLVGPSYLKGKASSPILTNILLQG